MSTPADRVNGYRVQGYGYKWQDIGTVFTYEDATKEAKKLSRQNKTDGSDMIARVRWRRKTLAWFERGKQIHPTIRTLFVWPNGAREWQ